MYAYMYKVSKEYTTPGGLGLRLSTSRLLYYAFTYEEASRYVQTLYIDNYIVYIITGGPVEVPALPIS